MRYYQTDLDLARSAVREMAPWPVRAALAVLGVILVFWLAVAVLVVGGGLVAFVVLAIIA